MAYDAHVRTWHTEEVFEKVLQQREWLSTYLSLSSIYLACCMGGYVCAEAGERGKRGDAGYSKFIKGKLAFDVWVHVGLVGVHEWAKNKLDRE